MKTEQKIKGHKIINTIESGRFVLKINDKDVGIQRDADSKLFSSELLQYQTFDDPMKLARRLIELGWPEGEDNAQ